MNFIYLYDLAFFFLIEHVDSRICGFLLHVDVFDVVLPILYTLYLYLKCVQLMVPDTNLGSMSPLNYELMNDNGLVATSLYIV